MRTTLLTTATLFSLGLAAPSFAQTPAPTTTESPSAAAPASDGTLAIPAKPHHRMVHKVADTDSGPWAHQPGTGESGPASSVASNIDGADSHSDIAPHLPQPSNGTNGSPELYLKDAQQALASHKTGLAQQALEMAETRLLDRSTPVNQAGQPDQSPEIREVSQARQALGHGDVARARSAIQTALASAPTSSN